MSASRPTGLTVAKVQKLQLVSNLEGSRASGCLQTRSRFEISLNLPSSPRFLLTCSAMFLHILRRLHKTYSIQEQTSPGEDNHELIIIYFRNHRVKCYSCELVSAPDISLHPYNLLEQMLAESTEAAVYSNIQHYTALWMLANRKHSSTSANTYLPSPPRCFLTYPLCNFPTRSSNQHY